jgi:hypothetical protein
LQQRRHLCEAKIRLHIHSDFLKASGGCAQHVEQSYDGHIKAAVLQLSSDFIA